MSTNGTQPRKRDDLRVTIAMNVQNDRVLMEFSQAAGDIKE